MLAGIGGENCVRRMKAIGSRNPNRFDFRIGAKFFDTVIGLRAVALVESFEHARIDVRCRHQFELRDLLHRRQDFRGADADADDTEL